ncbi:hypothetical protein DL767_008315 [Monosporascus sp. MG133]|nr:hypothetical protein DL767_008315 [Monosporascus sp. MG133]
MPFPPGIPERGARRDAGNHAAAMPFPDRRPMDLECRHCWEATYIASWESQEPGHGYKPGRNPGMLPSPVWDPDVVKAMLGERQ